MNARYVPYRAELLVVCARLPKMPVRFLLPTLAVISSASTFDIFDKRGFDNKSIIA